MSSLFVPPSTPPRKGRKQMKSPLCLKTPQTSSLKKVKDFFAATNANGKTPKSKNFGNSLMPITPDFTPQKSPRLIRKKKSNIEDIFKVDNTNAIIGDNLFFPTPSTVGSGRKSNPSSIKSHKVSLTMDALSKLNDNLNFESDGEVDDDDDDDVNFFIKTPSRGQKLQFNANLLDSPTTSFREPSSPTKMVPQTPLRQLIDDEKINDWHGKSKGYFSDDEEMVEDSVMSKPLVNPFLSDANDDIVCPNHKQSDVDYRTHVELIHNKTGERKVVKLLDRQANIKPKKLDFSSAI